jgi:predicted amidophosphoribosyltransferase
MRTVATAKDAQKHIMMNRSAVQYSDEMREWLARYKYRGDESLLLLLIEMLRYPYESLMEILSKSKKRFDYITYIPLSPERLLELRIITYLARLKRRAEGSSHFKGRC